ncbi:MAG TPA: MauE/DoxX family redox-associated membrane protein [Chloroflexota bacterium]|nr:MauE/DoxX family redox-associated membrane protein [Chloroflexota bacterium]
MSFDAITLRRVGPQLLLGARLVLAGIFLIAGVDKVQAPGAFADAVRTYHLLPPGLVLPFAFLVPWLEIAVAAYLLLGYMTRLAAAGAFLMLGMFIVALGKSLATGDTNHACGCFGSSGGANPILAFLSGGETITWWDLIRDIMLAALAAALVVYGAGALSLDGYLRGRRETPPAPTPSDRKVGTKKRKYRARA